MWRRKQKSNSSYQKAFNKLSSNGVIAELDALKAKEGSTFSYTISRYDYTLKRDRLLRKGSVKKHFTVAKIDTNIPLKSLGSIIGNIGITIIGRANGAVSVWGDTSSLDITAREMKKGGNQEVTEFVAQKAQEAKLLL
jgi:hypothetical protein